MPSLVSYDTGLPTLSCTSLNCTPAAYPIAPYASVACYRYASVSYDNGELVVDKEEVITRTLQLHEGLGHGDVVEVLDTWCDSSYPGSILASKAFTQVNSLGCWGLGALQGVGGRGRRQAGRHV